MGKVLLTKQVNDANQLQLDISGLSNGVYFVKQMNKEGVVATKRFVKTQ